MHERPFNLITLLLNLATWIFGVIGTALLQDIWYVVAIGWTLGQMLMHRQKMLTAFYEFMRSIKKFFRW